MKKLIIIVLGMLSISSFATENKISSKIKSVTVSLTGAQIFREGHIIYPKGVSKIVLEDVSPSIIDDGLQASSLGNYRILDVKHKIKYPEPVKVKPIIAPLYIQKEMNALNDSLFYQKLRETNYRMKIQTLNEQKTIIKKNKLTRGEGRSDSLPVLIELVGFYGKELFRIEDQLMVWNAKHQLLKKKITENTSRLNELNNYNVNTDQPVLEKKIIHQVEVTVYAETSGTADIEVSYLVQNAGWYPAYDLRVDDIDKPIKFTYKGYVYQNTGEDWKDVKLTLVTFDNRLQNDKPALVAWMVKYYTPPVVAYNQYKRKDYAYGSNMAIPSMPSEDYEVEEIMDEIKIAGVLEEPISKEVVSSAIESLANFSFDIELPFSITSDGKEVLMIINDYDVEASYTHYIVPKINTSAFLLASIPEWESLNLLQAQTNLYFNKTYLGNTVLNTKTLEDTMDVSLGIDRGIFCTRKKTQDQKKCRVIGLKKYQEITIEIVVKNNKNSDVNMVIEDQIPITFNKEEIEIVLHQKEGAEYDEATGGLSWNFKLKPQEKKVISFTYSLKYDKHKSLI